jgi:hypothetical protein
MDEHIGMFFDPERRANHHRVYSVSEYTPSLAVVNSWLGRVSGLGVKISPGVDLVELADFNAEVEFISLNGELKEAVLWFGSLKSTSRRATILPGGYTLTVDHQDKLLLSEPRAYLYEPDPAILRAGFVEMLGTRLDAFQLDPQIAYLTGDHLHESPFARVWPVEDWMPFQLKRLRAYLRERGIGKVTVKKRGSPLQPEELIRDLRLDGNEEKTLFLTQLQDRPIVVICGDEIKNVV